MAPVDASTKSRIARSAPRRGPVPPPRRPHPTCPAAMPATPAPTRPVVVPLAPNATNAVATGTMTLSTGASAAPEAEPRRRRTYVGLLVGALTAGLATGATIASLGVVISQTKSAPASAEVVGALHRLGVVSTTRPVTHIFSMDAGSNFPGLSDPVTYRAVGTAVTTVDLGTLSTADVHLNGTSGTVHIPTAQLGTPTLDRAQSGFVGQRKPGLLTRLFGTEASKADLESEAVSQLTDRANQMGLPGLAQEAAAAKVRTVLHRLGIPRVTVTFDQGS